MEVVEDDQLLTAILHQDKLFKALLHNTDEELIETLAFDVFGLKELEIEISDAL